MSLDICDPSLAALGLEGDNLLSAVNDGLRRHWEHIRYAGPITVGSRSHDYVRITLRELLSHYFGAASIEFVRDSLLARFNADHFYNSGTWRNRTEARASLSSFYDDLSRHVSRAAPLESAEANCWCAEALKNAAEISEEQGLMLVREIDSKTDIYRARCVRDGSLLSDAWTDGARSLGAPPPGMGGDNRLNPASQPCFYGATSIDTCLSELRLEAGWLVAVGRFRCRDSISLLDLTTLPKLEYRTSIFAPDYERRTQWVGFLKGLAQEISEPCWPGDNARSYRTTQYFAAFGARRAGLGVRGFIYSSSQSPDTGANIAVFGGPELSSGDNAVLEMVGDPIFRSVRAIRVDTTEMTVPPPVEPTGGDAPRG